MNRSMTQTVSSLAATARATAAHASGATADTLKILSLLALLGLALSAALLPHVGSDELGWLFTHLE